MRFTAAYRVSSISFVLHQHFDASGHQQLRELSFCVEQFSLMSKLYMVKFLLIV